VHALEKKQREEELSTCSLQVSCFTYCSILKMEAAPLAITSQKIELFTSAALRT
jgi:hypothetical protein